jgi:hypothetical protein
MVKDAMMTAPYGDRAAMVAAMVNAIKKGGLFAVDVVPTKIGEACHVWLSAATSGEANLTSMNGERRMRLTVRPHRSEISENCTSYPLAASETRSATVAMTCCTAMPSRRHSAAIDSSPRRPSSTMRCAPAAALKSTAPQSSEMNR